MSLELTMPSPTSGERIEHASSEDIMRHTESIRLRHIQAFRAKTLDRGSYTAPSWMNINITPPKGVSREVWTWIIYHTEKKLINVMQSDVPGEADHFVSIYNGKVPSYEEISKDVRVEFTKAGMYCTYIDSPWFQGLSTDEKRIFIERFQTSACFKDELSKAEQDKRVTRHADILRAPPKCGLSEAEVLSHPAYIDASDKHALAVSAKKEVRDKIQFELNKTHSGYPAATLYSQKGLSAPKDFDTGVWSWHRYTIHTTLRDKTSPLHNTPLFRGLNSKSPTQKQLNDLLKQHASKTEHYQHGVYYHYFESEFFRVTMPSKDKVRFIKRVRKSKFFAELPEEKRAQLERVMAE